MPTRLPDKTRLQERLPKRFNRKERLLQAFQQHALVLERREFEVKIDDIGSRGDGISRIQSFLIFVPKAKVGERIKVKAAKVNRGFALAEKVN